MKRTLYVSLLTALVLVSAAKAQDLSGHWEGSITIQTREARMEMDLRKDSKGNFGGTVATPEENLHGVVLRSVAVKGITVGFYARDDQRFDGALSPDGKSLSGNLSISGYAIPFELKRTGDAQIAPVPDAPKDLQGNWQGTLSAGGRQEKVELHVDGAAYVVLPDEGGLTIPVTNIKRADAGLEFETGGGFGSFAGTLNGDELKGTYHTGSLDLPLTLRRQPSLTSSK